jgi:hypothetical protein
MPSTTSLTVYPVEASRLIRVRELGPRGYML